MSTQFYHTPRTNCNTPSETRTARAAALVAAGSVSRMDGGPRRFFVASQSGHGGYVVDLRSHRCDCADYQTRHNACKHLQAAEAYEQQTARLDGWERRVADLCEQHGLTLRQLKDRILGNIIGNDYSTPSQTAALDALDRIFDRQRAQAVRQ